MGKKILITLAVIVVLIMVCCGVGAAWYLGNLKDV